MTELTEEKVRACFDDDEFDFWDDLNIIGWRASESIGNLRRQAIHERVAEPLEDTIMGAIQDANYLRDRAGKDLPRIQSIVDQLESFQEDIREGQIPDNREVEKTWNESIQFHGEITDKMAEALYSCLVSGEF